MQTIDGIVVNGEIVLQSSQKLPEGARVRVELVRSVPIAPISTAMAILEEAVEHRKAFGGRTKEEIDADIVIKEKLGENIYVASHPEKGKIRKKVCYYLAEAPYLPLKLEEEKGGLDDVRWFNLEEIADLNIYADILPIITKGINHLLSTEN